MLLVGAGLLSLAALAPGAAPQLAGLRSAILGAAGLGSLPLVAAAIAAGALIVWPKAPAPPRPRVAAGALAALALLGLLSLASAPAGGGVGRAALRLASPAGPVGEPLALAVALLASAAVALRVSLGRALVAAVAAARFAGAHRRHHARPPIPPESPAAGVELAQAAGVADDDQLTDGPAPGTEGGEEDAPTPAVEWGLPPLSLLDVASPRREQQEAETGRTARLIESTLATFGVEARVTGVSRGPAVTQYALLPAPGVPVRRVVALQNDLSLALAAAPLRIEAPIPGQPAIGIEVPNRAPALVTIREVVASAGFQRGGLVLPVALGNDVAGKPVSGDLTGAPHLLICGATGQGKSVCVNCLIASLLLRHSPERLRLVLIDPKRVELQAYRGLPHLACPVIVEHQQAAAALRWAVAEMERRYRLLEQAGARHIAAYNERAAGQPLPYVVVVIDELADLMMVAAGEVEELVCRIAQLARAVGIHLVIATQRPSTDVITGLIKANIPSRIAFAVGSQVDSRVVLDQGGAEKLLGRGDMLYQPVGAGKPVRLQGAFISDREVEALVGFWRGQGEPAFLEVLEGPEAGPGEAEGRGGRALDPLFARAARTVVAEGAASVSLVQRKFNVGYSRAGRLVDQLAEHRVVGAYQGSRSREVLMSLGDVGELLGQLGLGEG